MKAAPKRIEVGDRVDHPGEPYKPGTVRQLDWGCDAALVHWDDSGLTDWTDLMKLRQWPPPEHPALFTGDRVRDILDGNKTQTRRPVQGTALKWLTPPSAFTADFVADPGNYFSPLGYPGHRLWVRETWRCEERVTDQVDGIRFRADGGFVPIANTKTAADLWVQANVRRGVWRPSMHMPRWACRILLDVVAVRIERLQDISDNDARAEGFTGTDAHGTHYYRIDSFLVDEPSPRAHFVHAWNELYEKTAPWSSNPWVWVCEFKRSDGAPS